ncbi:MAG: shikimate kinase [Deltaproteobacteria bacterium]|nr:shikimate kinase [Deltaproteobacteria bacterium]MBW2041978.1 shikimate kinase [Deltaproteobacteria bacterium]
MNFYLIGYRCSGKTRIGKVLAERLGWGFIDTDDGVTAAAGRSIRDLVAAFGWPDFRQREHEILKGIAQRDRRVVATGGGIVLEDRNIFLMRKTGKIVWLQAAPETVRRRMILDPKSAAQRPALTSKGFLEEIETQLNARIPLYAGAADVSIPTDELDAATAADTLVRWIKEKGMR